MVYILWLLSCGFAGLVIRVLSDEYAWHPGLKWGMLAVALAVLLCIKWFVLDKWTNTRNFWTLPKG